MHDTNVRTAPQMALLAFERHENARPHRHDLPPATGRATGSFPADRKTFQLALDFSASGKRCHDCRTRVSLLPGRRYPEAWSEVTFIHQGGRETTLYWCEPCGMRRLEHTDDGLTVAA